MLQFTSLYFSSEYNDLDRLLMLGDQYRFLFGCTPDLLLMNGINHVILYNEKKEPHE